MNLLEVATSRADIDTALLELGYLMNEQLREVFQQRAWQAPFMLRARIDWVMKSRCRSMKKVARAIRADLPGIDSALIHQLSSGRLEGSDSKLKLLSSSAWPTASTLRSRSSPSTC